MIRADVYLCVIHRFLLHVTFHARNPKRKSPGAGRRVKVEAEGIPRNDLDAPPGDLPLEPDSRAQWLMRVHRRNGMGRNFVERIAVPQSESKQEAHAPPKDGLPRETILEIIGNRL